MDDITIEFDYISDLLIDDLSVFTQYALIQESFVFSIKNKFMEFEELTLEENTISFSKDN